MAELITIIGKPAALTLVTLITAVTAAYLYWRQRRDRQKDAANIVLREIRDAEDMLPTAKRVIQAAREMGIPEKIQILKSNSWTELQHVLARRLPQDVIKTIGEFYSNCRLLDEALAIIDEAFYKNADQNRVHQFRVIANFLEARVKATKSNPKNDPKITAHNEEQEQTYQRRAADFKTHWPSPNSSYVPVRAASDAEKYFELVPRNLSQTRVGDKLRNVGAGFLERLFDRKEV